MRPSVPVCWSTFQSTPAIAGERCGVHQRPRSLPTSFNPRPPSLASGATALDAHAALAQVSIHARHRWRAVPRHRGPCDPAHVVSIHARHRWRAVLGDGPHGGVVQLVSIHARHRWRAVRHQHDDPAGHRAVSIHARHRWRAVRAMPPWTRPTNARFNPRPPSLASGAASPTACVER